MPRPSRPRRIPRKIEEDLLALKVDGSFSTWPCLYGGDLCLLVAMKNGKPMGACLKATRIEAKWGRVREKRLRKARCPHPDRKTFLGFTQRYECRFADGSIHKL